MVTCSNLRDWGKLATYFNNLSADFLLGVPHNWIQTWAMLVWFADQTGYKVGTMQWTFGDAHIYIEDSHIEAAKAIANISLDSEVVEIELEYNPTDTRFLASDFSIPSKIPEPIVLIKPKLI